MKGTRRCNLRCTYCTDRRGKGSPRFDVELAATLFDSIAADATVKSCTFIWHGGEPLVLGVPFFRKAVYLQSVLLHEPLSVQNVLQTNACLVSDDWAAHFREHDFTIGVSLDGPEAIQNRSRPLRNGTGSFDQCMGGLQALKRQGVKFGILSVVSEELLALGPDRLVKFFEEIGVSNYALLSLRGDWERTEDAIAYNKQYGQFMSAVAGLWFEKDDPELRIRELDSKLDRFFGLPHKVCKDAGQCVGNYFGVEADGSVWHCDKFFDDSRFYLGNFRDQSLAEIRASERMAELTQLEEEVRSRCHQCRWFHLCGGGCLFDSMYLQKIGGTVDSSDCVQFSLFETLSVKLAKCPSLLRAAAGEEAVVGPVA